MINIAKLLRNAPEGMKLYSPLFGEVKFKYVDDSKFGIVVEDIKGCCRSFDKYGRYFTIYDNAECLLFPSKDYHTWQGWTPCVELKFKVGDWVVRGKGFVYEPSLITEIRDYYICELLNGERVTYTLSDVHKNFHLWTIADAKDGDVLVLNGKPFIYSSHKYGKNYCYIDDCGQFRASFNLVFQGNCVCPATKEQRNFLFAKMRESGYEWNEKNKELRKIQPHYDIVNFHAGMPVLVRDGDWGEWKYVSFSHYRKAGTPFCAGGQYWFQCIPFNDDTKHLLGTTDIPSEKYINW